MHHLTYMTCINIYSLTNKIMAKKENNYIHVRISHDNYISYVSSLTCIKAYIHKKHMVHKYSMHILSHESGGHTKNSFNSSYLQAK